MRTWISFRTPFRGIRVGVSLPNPAARVCRVSATGAKVWYAGSALMLATLAIWLVVSRDEGRLNENFLLVIGLAWCLWYLFGLVVVALFPPAVDR
jgi:hypothetical protein